MMQFRRLAVGAMALFATTVVMSLSANAATLTIDPSNPIDGKTWSITPSDYLQAAYYDANPTPQSPASVANFLKTWFSLPSAPSLVGQIDKLSGDTLDYTNLDGFNVIGIHLGKSEFAFLFSAPITHFIFTVSSNNLSNVRVYCSLASCTPNDPGPGPGPGETPIPGAAFLMGSVLAGGVGFGAWRRRRRGETA